MNRRLLRTHLQQPDFELFALGEQWLRFAATESDCDSLMLLNAGLILSWVIVVVKFSTCCVFRKKLSRFQVVTNVSQMFPPIFPMSSGFSKKEPLILNISPLDLSDRSGWPPFLEFLLRSINQKFSSFSSIFLCFRLSNSHCSQLNETFLPRSSITIDKRILEPFYELFSCFVFKK